MSAEIPSSMPLSDLLKPTGYNCPSELQGKTFDEATSGSDTKISTNTDKTIDVSAYTEPVVVEPAEGYDATKKATITLDNIPSGRNALFMHISSYESVLAVTDIATEPLFLSPDDILSNVWALNDNGAYDATYHVYTSGQFNWSYEYLPMKIGERIYVVNASDSSGDTVIADLVNLEYTEDHNYPTATYNGQTCTPEETIQISSGTYVTLSPVQGRLNFYISEDSIINFDQDTRVDSPVIVYSVDTSTKKVAITYYNIVEGD